MQSSSTVAATEAGPELRLARMSVEARPQAGPHQASVTRPHHKFVTDISVTAWQGPLGTSVVNVTSVVTGIRSAHLANTSSQVIWFDLMLQGLISCFQLLHQVVSLSKCCSQEYSALGRYRFAIGRVLNYCHGDHANTHLITRGGLASSPWSGEWQWENMGLNIGSGPGPVRQIQSQLSRMERRGHWDSCQISLPLTLSGLGRPAATLWHWMLATTWILCIWGEFDQEGNKLFEGSC